MSPTKTTIRFFLIVVFCLFLVPEKAIFSFLEKRIYFINETEMSSYEKELIVFAKNRLEEKTCGLISFDIYFVNLSHKEFFKQYQKENTIDFMELSESKIYYKEIKNEYVGFWKRNVLGFNHITIVKESVLEFEIPNVFAHEILHSYNVEHVHDKESIMSEVMNIPSINFEFSEKDVEGIEKSLQQKICP